ncbi:hypothetical protein [Novosphingobium percolationis]|uniref:hypothetical protein n=1 Tax=Novosphingobium percolationis TaxID=2871811 RepID=UPI001CD2E5CC|nr:hypothetical protein [Novosphingobium percolationis]
MGQHLHENFNAREEWKAARLTEIEFEEMARALKAVAKAHDRSCDDVIDTFAREGLAAALNLLAASDGAATTAEYYHLRAPSGH